MSSQDINIFESIDNFLAEDSFELSTPPVNQDTSAHFKLSLDLSAASELDDSSPIAKKRKPKNSKTLNLSKDLDSEIAINLDADHSIEVKDDDSIDEIIAAIPDGRRLTRGRRQEVAESVKKAQVSSPVKKTLSNFDEDNEEIMVKVYWESKLQKHPLRMHQQFSHLCETLAEQNSCDAGSIVLTLNDKLINQTATPDSIGYTIGKFIYARSMQHAFKNQAVSKTSIELKIQSAIWKRPIHIRIEPTQKMKILVILCAEQLKCPAKTLLFKFDGELLDLEATPNDLELEGGEVLDLKFIEA